MICSVSSLSDTVTVISRMVESVQSQSCLRQFTYYFNDLSEIIHRLPYPRILKYSLFRTGMGQISSTDKKRAADVEHRDEAD